MYFKYLLRLIPQSQGMAAQTVDNATELLPENLRPYRLILNIILLMIYFTRARKTVLNWLTVKQISETLFYTTMIYKKICPWIYIYMY